MLRPLFILTLVATAFAAASCGGDEGTTSTTTATASSSSGGGVTAAEACDAVAAGVCSKLTSCSPFLVQIQYGDEAACRARNVITCPANFTAPGSTTTPEIAKACGDAIATISCDDLFERNLPAECDLNPGTLSNGDACGREVQCESKYCNNAGKACGVCAKVASAGDACGESDDCAKGLICAQGKCIVRGDAGASCDAATPCKATLACSGGKCATPAGAGEACDMKDNNCDNLQGLSCNTMSVCQKIKLAEPGEVCGLVGTDYIACSNGGHCKTDGGMMGTCLAAADDGEACDAVAGPKCMPQAVCTSGLCTLNDGATCM